MSAPLRRVALVVAAERVEEARAWLLDLVPQGFEERDVPDGVELAAYVEPGRAAALVAALPGATVTEVAEGWEDAWRAFHRPVRIGPLWVGPPWLEPDADAVPLVIDPGQAFGTGAHATTRLSLGLLLEQEPTSLLDLGCGSGVLSIAAALSGFAPVVAVDLDEAAVEATRENAVVNGVELEARRADVLADPLPEAGLVVANIETRVLEPLAARVRAPRWIVSGILARERPTLAGWTLVERREDGEWAAELRVRDA